MSRPRVARTIFLLALLLLPIRSAAEPQPSPAPGPTSAPGATRATVASWDLLTAIDGRKDLPKGVSAAYRGAHGETRAVLHLPLPGELALPLEVPPEAVLAFGYAFQSAAFMTETPELAEPGRVRISFTEEGGETRTLLERRVDIRGKPADRRWFDERLDLSALAGKRGTISFAALNDGDPEKAKGTNVYFSAPRVLRKSSEPPSGMNLLLITVDCLRADHVSAYGYEKPTTPNLDRLAGEGVRFANAFAGAPMTLPSIPQLFTSSLFPTKDVHTLLEPVAHAGIPSVAVVNNVWIPLWLSQGEHAVPPGTFDAMITGELDAKAITDRAIDWLTRHPDDRFVMYLHYLDAHTPYGPPKPYIEMFADPGYAGKVGDTFTDAEGAAAGSYDEADKKKITALYDAAIRYIDEQIGRVIEHLAKTGDLERTAIVITADHGEELWDHGRFFHGQSLYDELLHVPLIVRVPKAAPPGTVVERAVRLLDVAPSLLEWAALERPATFEGRSLTEVIAAPDAPPDDLVATATQAQFPTRYALRSGTLKLVESLDTGKRELFDLQSDPHETKNLADERPEERAALEKRLWAAREVLRKRGYQVRVVGPQKGRATVELQFKSEPRSGTFLTLDRTLEGGSPRLAMSADGLVLTAKLDVDAQGGGFRFDRLLSPRNIAKNDKLAIELKVDGAPGSRSAIALGPSGTMPTGDVVDIAAPSLTTTTEPPCPAPPTGVKVCLWRYPGEKPAEMPEISDPAVREKLRALGYLQ